MLRASDYSADCMVKINKLLLQIIPHRRRIILLFDLDHDRTILICHLGHNLILRAVPVQLSFVFFIFLPDKLLCVLGCLTIVMRRFPQAAE